MIGALLGRFKGLLIGIAAALLALLTFYERGKAKGKEVEQKKSTQRDLDEARQHAETVRENSIVQAEVNRLPDSDLDERLRKWTRD
jgi:stringent starvation protein B